MKLRALVEGLAVPAIIAAVLAKDTLVAITADRTVGAAGAADIVIGRLFKPAREINGDGTVETKFKELIEIKATGAIAAGELVIMAADDPAGTQTVAPLAAEALSLVVGICWKGGADNATIEVLTF